jgi:hypothetical protein
MNRIAAVFLSVLLLAAGSGLWTGSSANAAPSVKIIVNGQALQVDGQQAYTSGSAPMLPLRETAEVLKYKTSFIGATGQFKLTRVQETIEFRLGGKEIILDGKNKVPFTESIELKQQRAYVPLSFFAAIGLVTSYNPATGQVEIYSPEVTAGAVAGLLAAGNYTGLRERYFATEAEQPSLPVIQQNWEGVTVPAGQYFGVKSTDSRQNNGSMTITSVLSFSKSEALLTLELNTSGKIVKLSLTPLQAAEVLASPLK